ARLGRKVVPLACDIASFEQIDRVYETLDKEFGRIDILGNVAGEAHTGPAEDMSIEQVQQTFHNLVISRFYATQQAGRRMLRQGKGSIMSIGSIAGVSSLGR